MPLPLQGAAITLNHGLGPSGRCVVGDGGVVFNRFMEVEFTHHKICSLAGYGSEIHSKFIVV